jgi:signal transduction histidine kinase/DNA-binding response OmpR family regulator
MDMDFPNFIQLYNAKEALAGIKDEILHEWVSQKQCAAILSKHEINPQWFKEKYASKVFDYFMGVVAGDVELGQCPVMKEFIEYLKNQEIRSDELFLLCTYFKRSMVNGTYTLGINSQGLFESISYLFDMNFAGVLTIYTDTIYQKEQEAIEANIAKEYFLSNMSHEIRTPLNAILGFVHLLKEESLGEKVEKCLDIIGQSGENLLHIINDILDFSKLRSGEFVIEPHLFDVYDEMSNALELFVPSAQLKSITINYSINEQIPRFIIADSFRIQQIVGNLLSNAIKFTPPSRSIDVKIEIAKEVPALIISVRDYGLGISVADQQRIFNPFRQAAQGAKLGGSGLGLSICKQLSQQMGGEITLESQLGWGSLFEVILPIELSDENLNAPKSHRSDTTLLKGNVLVAEDNSANQELIRMTLERYGLKVTVVGDGLAAYEHIKVHHYDLVFMDEQMPVMNGSEAVAKIRQFEHDNALGAIGIVALSANVIKGAREKALECGYNAFMGKPFNMNELESVLEHYLSKKRVNNKVTASSNESLSSMQQLQKLLMLEPKQIKSLLDLFHVNMVKMMLELEESIVARDFDSIARIAHAIKGSSANFRFTEIFGLASKIEEGALDHSNNFDFTVTWSDLKIEYAKLPKSEDLM